ncbi:sex peptide receptor-like [Planococcus citri]|uniref:sex peptide receptor-like n=1 Tax=Planococcus citri TaxID=170843 RepID=UPI0031F78FDB
MNQSELFCGTAWNETQFFITKYLYGSVILVLESIGTPFSILTVIIFAKNVFSSSNILFISLAISDLMVLLLGIPQLWFRISHNHIHYKLDRGSYTDFEKVADHWLATGQKIFYNISLYQTMILAIWRYIAITLPLKERIFCNVRMTLAGVLTVYTLCFSYFVPDLLHVPPTTEADNDKFEAQHSNLFYDLFYIIVLKLIPCTIVTICTVRFIRVLRESKARRKEMIPNFNKELEEKEIQMNRTTKMVLGITIFFLTNNTGLTTGRILILIFGQKFKKDCFPAILCINNLLVLIYTVIPFVVYYVTSQQFRDNFKALMPCKRCVLFQDKNNTVDLTEFLDIEMSKDTSVSSCVGKK